MCELSIRNKWREGIIEPLNLHKNIGCLELLPEGFIIADREGTHLDNHQQIRQCPIEIKLCFNYSEEKEGSND
jgi:hypothetical protein